MPAGSPTTVTDNVHRVTAMRVHYLQHEDCEDIGNIRPWLEQRGWPVTATQLHRGENLPAIDSLDWLIIMGGSMGAYDEDRYPWLIAEKLFIDAVIKAGKPVLGICLGSQLLADVLGGEVFRAPAVEVGWYEVVGNPYLQADESAPWLPPIGRFLCWHGDTFTLPPGALRLASSGLTKEQGFLWGDRVVALQFHLEAKPGTPEIFLEASGGTLDEGPYIQAWQGLRGDAALFELSRTVMWRLLDHLAAVSTGT